MVAKHDLDFLDFIDEEHQLHELEHVVDFDCIGSQRVSAQHQAEEDTVWYYDDAIGSVDEMHQEVTPSGQDAEPVMIVLVPANQLASMVSRPIGSWFNRQAVKYSAFAS